MSAHLQWAIINKFNCYDIKKAGTTWTKEPGHLKGKKSLKYNTLVNPGSKSSDRPPSSDIYKSFQTLLSLLTLTVVLFSPLLAARTPTAQPRPPPLLLSRRMHAPHTSQSETLSVLTTSARTKRFVIHYHAPAVCGSLTITRRDIISYF